LTAPNGQAQAALLTTLLKQHGCAPGDVEYIETHGTGTRLGDPIELQAIGEVLTKERPVSAPLMLGALKAQLGHLEAAAGAAAVLRVISMLKNSCIYPDPPVQQRNSLIPWENYAFDLCENKRSWSRHKDRRLAMVNAFGLSGTNVGLLMGDAPNQEPVADSTGTSAEVGSMLCVSGSSIPGLIDNLAAWKDAVESSKNISQLLKSSCVYRDHFEFRFASSGQTQSEIIDELHTVLREGSAVQDAIKNWRVLFTPLTLDRSMN